MNERKLIDEIKRLTQEKDIIGGFFDGSKFISDSGITYTNLILTTYDPGKAFITKYQDKWLCVVSSSNELIRTNIITDRKNRYIEPLVETNKVKILFYVEKENSIDFYIGGHIATPKLVHSVDKDTVAIQTIVGYIHNYGRNHEFTISYDEFNNVPEESEGKKSYKCTIVQGTNVLNDETTEGENDPTYYLYNHYYEELGFYSSVRSPKYKGNKVWLSEEIIPYVPGLTFGDFSIIYYPNAEVVNLQGTYDSANFTYDVSYENFNVALLGTEPIINTGITIQNGSPNLFASTSKFTKTMFNYLVNSTETLVADLEIFTDRTSRMLCNGYKLFSKWKDSFITQEFNFDYREYSYGSEIAYGTPISLNVELLYTLKSNNENLLLNNNNIAGLVTSITPVTITENSPTLTLNLDYFTVDIFNISFIDVDEFIGVPILFAKKDDGFTWYAKGTISSINIDGTATQFSAIINSCEINVSVSSVQKVDFISFASDNGTLLINNGSINSFVNSFSIFSRFTPFNLYVINDYNLITGDCFINDFTNGEDSTRPYFQPTAFSYNYPFENRFDYSVINNLISKTTYKNKTIYVANVLDDVKTQNTVSYIESWKIDNDGNFNRQDTILKEPVYSLKNSSANILSISYYP